METLQFLADLETEKKARRQAAWAAFRALLEKSMAAGGQLNVTDRKSMAALVATLELSAEDVRSHADALQSRDKAIADAARREETKREFDAHLPIVEEWWARRCAAMATLDAEGVPLTQRRDTLAGILHQFDMRPPNINAAEIAFPEFFGIEIIPPSPRVEPSETQCRQDQVDLADMSICQCLAAALRNDSANGAAVASMSQQHRELLSKGIAKQWIELSAIHRDALAAASAKDAEITPRKTAIALAEKIATLGGHRVFELPLEERKALQSAAGKGWIKLTAEHSEALSRGEMADLAASVGD